MHTLLTTGLLVLDATFQSHLSLLGSKLHIATVLSGHAHIIYGADAPEETVAGSFYEIEGVSCMCASGTDGNNFNYIYTADAMARSYVDYVGSDKELWSIDSTSYSCTLFDSATNSIWLVGDRTGSCPLWYSLDSNLNTFMVTSDLIGAQRIKYNAPLTPLGPGQVVSLDLSSFELKYFSHWQSETFLSDSGSSLIRAEKLDYYTNNLFKAATESIWDALNSINDGKNSCTDCRAERSSRSHKTDILKNEKCNECWNNEPSNRKHLFLELEVFDSSSILLECVLSTMNITRSVRVVRTLVADGWSRLPDIFYSLIGDYNSKCTMQILNIYFS